MPSDFETRRRCLGSVQAAKNEWESALRSGEYERERDARRAYRKAIRTARLEGFGDPEIGHWIGLTSDEVNQIAH